MVSSQEKGFTLIELLISAAIITIITGIVLVRFSSFDSTTLLKSLAYEVALTIREAQIYALSVVNTGSGTDAHFRYPYGLTFTENATSYTFFRYNDVDPTGEVPQNPPGGSNTISIIRTIALGGSTKISDVCVTTTSGDLCASDDEISHVDISFRRPEFSALFYTPEIDTDEISAAKIKFQSTRDATNTWVVEVKLLGQVMVYPG
jgi:prepilin-type N-terminal cleavage/methylation domain-containing protein